MTRLRALSIWGALAFAVLVPILAAARSPLLAWRDPVYIAAGFAGVVAMALLLLQPLLAAGYLPGFAGPPGRRLHRRVGGGLVVAVALHVAGLWITSPPDVVDALLLVSPTPFSAWGVLAMWALVGSALLALLRRRLRIRWRRWRIGHTGLAAAVVAGSIVHALLIEGAMEWVSKAVLCGLVAVATLAAFVGLKAWGKRKAAGAAGP